MTDNALARYARIDYYRQPAFAGRFSSYGDMTGYGIRDVAHDARIMNAFGDAVSAPLMLVPDQSINVDDQRYAYPPDPISWLRMRGGHR